MPDQNASLRGYYLETIQTARLIGGAEGFTETAFQGKNSLEMKLSESKMKERTIFVNIYGFMNEYAPTTFGKKIRITQQWRAGGEKRERKERTGIPWPHKICEKDKIHSELEAIRIDNLNTRCFHETEICAKRM